ncbi:MAG: TetR family transcriptional regulator C-terminal domain-containing protein [Alphaproteobacteria bacterium]|jgi:TetR/AcrR family transcriptional repressor of nem operon|nr:TetR family transcriptional regulator C-terminal domain-containing protein [Alphaproteobacteria bacterium]
MARTDVREKLLTAGLEALHKRGFNGTGVQDITDAAKVPKGSFYNHFESKDALGVEVVERYAANGAGRREPLMEGSGPPLTRLRTYFKALNQLGPATGFSRGCLLGNFGTELSAQSPAIRAALEAAFDDWTKAIAQVIAEAQKAGDVSRDIPAETLANFLLNAWEGAVMRSKVEKDPAALDAFLSVTFNKILT